MAGTLLSGLRKRLARCRTGVGMRVRPQLLAPGPSDGLAPGAEKVGRHHPPLQPVPGVAGRGSVLAPGPRSLAPISARFPARGLGGPSPSSPWNRGTHV